MVALRKESVDRNIPVIAWERAAEVALRKESVDRNIFGVQASGYNALSLSARRAWIEILTTGHGQPVCGVALRKESVDRNCDSQQ